MTIERTPQDKGASDSLVELYRDAVKDDAGPSAASREKVLAYAREQAEKRARSNPKLEPAKVAKQPDRREAANDRRWLRQALGSLAIIGVVGWLTMQHLEEPGAPQLDQVAPASVQQAPVSPAPAQEPSAGAVQEAAPVAADAERKSNMAAKPVPTPSAPMAKKQMERAEEKVERAVPQAAPAPLPAPLPAPAQSPAAAPVLQKDEVMSAPQAAPPAAASEAARGPSAMRERANTLDHKSLSRAKPAAKVLPDCDESMDADALAEQSRRIKSRDEARVAGQPLPEPAPICKPLPPKSPASSPESQ
ncbi:hypothetical protein G7048_04360 [Diaphorobacter sp. HDW4B]|uniref:hypothetical protein n=1 Tax=Diaphorobacter sp. HDW4B TaxID=2714925 RepID=UPI0014091A49|nr:hypothetical protein [Diaphorobacter sp. HDW4B]QIL69667.1 hypothetical protein G7048_04360 [Diaphorobacter sp. HDW4B]